MKGNSKYFGGFVTARENIYGGELSYGEIQWMKISWPHVAVSFQLESPFPVKSVTVEETTFKLCYPFPLCMVISDLAYSKFQS